MTTTTTTNGFDTVSQAGSGIAWTGLSNMPYPTEGSASATLTASVQDANTISLIKPHEMSGIPTGAKFVSMKLNLTLKKTGIFSSSTNLRWSGKTPLSTGNAWTYTLSVDETEQSVSFDGDQAYWQISSFYSPADLISLLRSGALYLTVDVETTVAIACTVRIRAATVAITYETTQGKRGAIIAVI